MAGALLARDVARSLAAAGAPRPASLGLILTDDRELTGLNQEHMGRSGPTDVLSFPLLPLEAFPSPEGGPKPLRSVAGRARGGGATVAPSVRGGLTAVGFALPPGARLHLGDIVVSVERAIDQADSGRGGWTGDMRWSPADELRLLVTHGVLHVCGWDHAGPVEEAAMRALEAQLLGRTPPD